MAIADVYREPHLRIRPLLRVEYDQLVGLGVFDGEPVELLEGALVEMSPEGEEHRWVVHLIMEPMVRGLPPDLSLQVGHPWAASERSEPEPDLAVVPRANYRRAHPAVARLIMEVSYSSRRKDLGLKARIYAEAGVEEYWVIDLVQRLVHVHRRPLDGRYTSVSAHGSGETLDACGVPIDLAELFGDRDDPAPDQARPTST